MSESALEMPLQVRAKEIGVRRKAARIFGELREAVAQAAYALSAHRLRAIS